MPIRKVAIIFPVCVFFFLLVMTPFLTNSTTPSVNISECIPKSFLSVKKLSTASGIAPIPSCKVSPSFISFAQFSPIFFSISPISGLGNVYIVSSHSTIQVAFEICIKLSPLVLGIFLFTCKITVFATSQAIFV